MTTLISNFILVLILSAVVGVAPGTAIAITIAKSVTLSTPNGGDFTLPTADKKVIDTKQLRGSNLIIVFGFTKCKAICPLVLNKLKSMKSQLSESQRAITKIIFISVDPVRDTNESIKNYVSSFDPDFLSGTDKDKNLKKILHQFGARYHRFKTKNNFILVDHTSDIYIVNKKGIWTDTLKADASAEQLLASLKVSDSVDSFESRFPKSRQVQLEVVSSKQCNLTTSDCSFSLQNETFKISIQGRPVQALNDFKVLITSQQNSKLKPVAVDFEGVLLSMGYIRPMFTQEKNNLFLARINLPVCELKTMQWKVTIVFTDSSNKNYAKQFRLNSAG